MVEHDDNDSARNMSAQTAPGPNAKKLPSKSSAGSDKQVMTRRKAKRDKDGPHKSLVKTQTQTQQKETVKCKWVAPGTKETTGPTTGNGADEGKSISSIQ